MKLIIPTYRRNHAQHTFNALPRSRHADVVFVADEQDTKGLHLKYKDSGATFLTPPPEFCKSIAQKRAWILRWAVDQDVSKIVMFDDDLRFAYRPNPIANSLQPANSTVVDAFLTLLDERLDDRAHAGFSARQGNNHMAAGWTENTRMMYVLGYKPQFLTSLCELGRIEHREDMDYTLQLLRLGYPNSVLADVCVDQSYNAPGGASASGRTMDMSNADADKLAELHPGFVRVVEKAYKGSINRREVVVSWKKAFESSKG